MKNSNAAATVALLRGVNVGGKNILPMKDLCAIFTAAGCRDVKNYIQSGNVVFQAEPDLLPTLPAAIQKQIAARFGFQSPVILRTREELHYTLQNNPFVRKEDNGKSLFVMFLERRPDPDAVSALDPRRSQPDEFALQNRDIYLWLPNGAAKTKLSNAWFDSKLKTIGTGRNWRTVQKLFDLTGPE